MWNKIRYAGDREDVRALYEEYQVKGFLNARQAGEREQRNRLRVELLRNGVLLNEALSPRIFHIASEVLRKLGVPGTFDVICVRDSSINAFAAVRETDTEPDQFIGITSGALELLDDGEIAFILAHEIGHILFRHNRLNGLLNLDPDNPRKTVLPYMGESLFLRWQKKREISADRVGLIACGSFEVAARALLKAGYGLSEKNLNLDVTSLMGQLSEVQDDPIALQSNFQSHPLLPFRLQALNLFDLQVFSPGQPLTPLDCDADVDALFDRFKRYPRNPVDEAVMRVVALAGLRLSNIDGDPDEDEIRGLITVLHQTFTDEPEQELCLDVEERKNRWDDAITLLRTEGNPRHTQFILSRLAEIAIADGKVLEKEAAVILQVAELLNFKARDAYQILISATQSLGFREDGRMQSVVEKIRLVTR